MHQIAGLFLCIPAFLCGSPNRSSADHQAGLRHLACRLSVHLIDRSLLAVHAAPAATPADPRLIPLHWASRPDLSGRDQRGAPHHFSYADVLMGIVTVIVVGLLAVISSLTRSITDILFLYVISELLLRWHANKHFVTRINDRICDRIIEELMSAALNRII